MKLEKGVRYLINPGSVGQPRDRNPRASCAIYDSETRIIKFHRLEYNIEEAQRKILAERLPPGAGRAAVARHLKLASLVLRVGVAIDAAVRDRSEHSSRCPPTPCSGIRASGTGPFDRVEARSFPGWSSWRRRPSIQAEGRMPGTSAKKSWLQAYRFSPHDPGDTGEIEAAARVFPRADGST